MAGEAIAREPEEGAIQVLLFKPGAFRRRNVSRLMALLASQGRVLSLQPVACLVVIEGLFRRLPVNKLEIHTVVLRVTTSALLVVGFLHQPRVIPAVRRDALSHLGVALQALEVLVSTCNTMAGSAIGCPTER